MKTYQTKADVIAHLTDLENKGLLSSHSNGWSESGPYYLNHGEYSQPDYRPTRYKDGWGIAKVFFYYAGTFNAPSRCRVDLSILCNDEYDWDGSGDNVIYELMESFDE